jgi:hypothetical protein
MRKASVTGGFLFVYLFMHHTYTASNHQELIDIVHAIYKKDNGAYIDYDAEAVKKGEYPITIKSNIKIQIPQR